MPNNRELIAWAEQWWTWLKACAALPIATPECRLLWEVVMWGFAALGAGLLGWVVWRVIDRRLQYAAALRAQAERERVAEPHEMARHRFVEAGDVADTTDPHLAAKIRAELDRQRLARSQGRERK